MTLFELGSLSLSVAKPTSRNKPQAKCQKADEPIYKFADIDGHFRRVTGETGPAEFKLV
jgi:hypothetical protein